MGGFENHNNGKVVSHLCKYSLDIQEKKQKQKHLDLNSQLHPTPGQACC